MNINEKIELFKGMIKCASPISVWTYDTSEELLFSNCEQEAILSQTFTAFGSKDNMFKYAKDNDNPLILASPIGLSWVAVFEKDNEVLKHVHVLGPVFPTEVSLNSIEKAISSCPELGLSIASKAQLSKALEKVPVVIPNMLNSFALMLNYCITGKTLLTSDLNYDHDEKAFAPDGKLKVRDRHKVWQAEQALLRMVREGDLNYKQVTENSSNISAGVPVLSKEPLRPAKDSVIVFISLCVRAAIEGGISPDQGYTIGDAYIQSVENSTTAVELAVISNSMYEEFISRVNRCRVNPNVSKQIQECCNYIEMHVEDNLDIETLAKRIGYAEYYLSRKFKNEMNVSLSDYIKIVRIERAKLLLVTTDYSLQEISERLGFCARSYMGVAFRELVGCSPSDFRKEHKRV